jgi:hypothetical protein
VSLVNKIVRKLAHSQALIGVKDRIGRRLRETYYNAEVLLRIQDKITPLIVEVDANAPVRINLLLPEIDFRTFYGGYIAKFNLAQKLTDAGYLVRFVIVDPCDIDEAAWRKGVAQYDGLENIFDRVEYSHVYDRKNTLTVSPNDKVIATTWWTAYIANSLAQDLNIDRFLYLIQEYEPFTFPMGSYYAIAHESYSFPHKAMFSSPQLQQYFEQSKIGIYSDSKWCKPTESMPFENAILAYEQSDLIKDRTAGSHKLLFYARPEAHAARNMFEVAYLALSKAIEQGAFDEGKWEFHGIGSSHGDIPLPKGHTLKMIGKFGLKEYKARLLNYDLGLSLMYTPHPSLLPLEMAAAGMWVVTSACENKTAAVLSNISSNLIGSEATIDGVAKGLGYTAGQVGDIDARKEGANVQWAANWDDAFSKQKMNQIINWLELS